MIATREEAKSEGQRILRHMRSRNDPEVGNLTNVLFMLGRDPEPVPIAEPEPDVMLVFSDHIQDEPWPFTTIPARKARVWAKGHMHVVHDVVYEVGPKQIRIYLNPEE